MTFDAIPFTREHYFLYSSWLEVRGRAVPKYEHLTKNGITVMADGKPAACGFLFSSGKACAAGNLASDPDSPGRSEAVQMLLDTLVAKAREGGHEVMFFNTNRTKLAERLVDMGFMAGDRDLVQYARAL